MHTVSRGGLPLVPALMLACTACGGSSSTHSVSPPAVSLPALSTADACASVVVARNGRVTAQRAVGIAHADASHALFDSGSAAKSLTAASIVLLAEDGKISLSARIMRYLPGVPPDKRNITVAQLLSHTSGLPQDFTSDQTQIDRDSAVRDILGLKRAPAGRFRYSNAGYTLLAAIVEHVARMPFRQFVEQRLLQPAGMTSTGWYGDTPPAGTAAAHGQVAGRDTGPAGTQAPASWATLGAGGMTSTATDLVLWLNVVNTGSLFSPTWRAEIFRGRVGIGAPGARAAYGWVVGATPDGQQIRLVGGDTDYGFTSDLRYYPGKDVATVALSCSDKTPAADLGHDLEAGVLHV